MLPLQRSLILKILSGGFRQTFLLFELTKGCSCSLYNAVNGSNYSNPAELEVNTLGNVLYLTDILTDQKAEVIQMILETYDKELHDKTLRNEGYETGKTAGISSERENGISRLLSALQELNISQRDAYTKLKEKYSLSDEEAEKYLKKYWEVV